MSNNYFEHQVVPQNSSTSPVENLANEVSTAFSKISEKLGEDIAVPSLTKALGNFVLAGLSYHGSSEDIVETAVTSTTTTDIPLTAKPEGAVSVSYFNPNTYKKEYLVQKQASQSFSGTNEFKVVGRVLSISNPIEGASLEISYKGLKPSLGSFDLKPNVIKDNSGFLKPLKERYDGTYSISFEENIQENIEKFVDGSLTDKNKVFLVALVDGVYTLLNYESVYADRNSLIFSFEEVLEEDYEVLVYVLNTTVETILSAIYLELINHTHNKAGSSSTIEHKDIISKHVNSKDIFYKENTSVGYDHPQFLNREGYNSEVVSAYENAMLGDLFLAANISESDQVFKTLMKDSSKILFGEPVAGSKIYYDSTLRAINLLSGADVNGLNIAVALGKKALSINGDSSFFSETEKGLSLKAKDNILKVEEGSIVADNIEAFSKVSSKIVETEGTTQGNVQSNLNGVNIEFTLVDTERGGKVIYDIPSSFKDISIEGGYIDKTTLRGLIQSSEGSLLRNDSGNFKLELNLQDFDIELRSGLKSSVKIGSPTSKQKIYVADYLGQQGSEADSNMYIENPLESGLYLLKDTSKNVVHKGVTYSFQKSAEGTQRIDSLKEWVRSSLYFGNAVAYTLSLDTSNVESRNGLKIGKTRLSTIGTGLDCPEGTTLLETEDTLHIIKPISDGDVECSSISYQSVNTGSLQVFGSLSVDTDLYVLGNTTTSGTTSTQNLTVNGTTTLSDLNTSGDVLFSGETSFVGSVAIKNSVDVSGTMTLKGSLSATDGTFSKYVSVGETLTVGGQTFLNDNVIIQGTLYTSEDFTTQGKIIAGSLKTGDLDSGTIRAQGSLSVVGSTSVEGSGIYNGNIETKASLLVGGSADVAGDLTAASVYATTDTTLMGRLTVDGVVQITTESFSLGSSNASLLMYGNLQVSGSKATFASDMGVQGELSVNGSSKFSDNVSVSGNLTTSSIVANSTVTIVGNLTATSADFSRKIYVQDGLKASGTSEFTTISSADIVTEELNSNSVYIRNSLNMGPEAVVAAYHVEASKFTQKDPGLTSTFAGETEFNNLVNVSPTGIVIGNKDIINTRNTSGVYITDNTITLGNNSTIKAVKIFANKGVPSGGNRDLNSGFCFSSNLAQGGEDGDTGFFATMGTGSGLDGSDIEVWIDNSRKYVFYRNDIAFNADKSLYGKAVVTLEMLQSMQSYLERKVSSGTSSVSSASWPVGSIFFTTNDQNPSAQLGFGTWVRYAAGRTIVGKATGSSNETGGVISGGLKAPTGVDLTRTGNTFGDFEKALAIANLPPHNHSINSAGYRHGRDGRYANEAYFGDGDVSSTANRVPDNATTLIGHTGAGVPVSLLQPSIVANIWNRIA